MSPAEAQDRALAAWAAANLAYLTEMCGAKPQADTEDSSDNEETGTMTETAAELQQQQIDQVNAERARLVTEQPPGWPTRYAELGEQITGLTRRWQDAYEREQIAGWWASSEEQQP